MAGEKEQATVKQQPNLWCQHMTWRRLGGRKAAGYALMKLVSKMIFRKR